MIDDAGHLVLSDFGVARLTDRTFRADLDLAAISHNLGANTLRKLHPQRMLSLETIDPESLADPKAKRAYDQLERQFREAAFQRMTMLYFKSFAHDPTDRDVWDAYRRGESSSVTAKRLGKTPDAVRQQRKRMLATIQSLAEI